MLHKYTLSSVVMANVAMLRLESVIKFSISKLHGATADGCFRANRLSVRIEAKRRDDFGELRNNCRTDTAGNKSLGVIPFKLQMARAASKLTISWR
jgi:hypothetical protein